MVSNPSLSPLLRRQHVMKLWRYERFNDIGLVTKMQSGIVVSYKVVWMITNNVAIVYFAIYSSDTVKWENRKVTCLHSNICFSQHKLIALNGIHHWFSNFNGSFITYDFYGDHDAGGCCRIYFPDSGKYYEVPRFRKTITTSGKKSP